MPIIGMTCGTLVSNGTRRHGVPVAYVRAIEQVGGVPLLLPLVESERAMVDMLSTIDGLLLTGGVDVDPQWYGQEPKPALGTVDPDRDALERKLTQDALERDLPILAICRGIQALNVFAGGTLYQDIRTEIGDSVNHAQHATGPLATHTIEVEPGTKLHTILGCERLKVNSHHHQAVDRVAPGFVISARALDDVIEGIEHPRKRFIVGVQCHPETIWEKYPVFRRLFDAFVQAAGARK